jgi:hypothetical protein
MKISTDTSIRSTRTDVRSLRAHVSGGQLYLAASKTVGTRLLAMLFGTADKVEIDGTTWIATGIEVER